jgi:2-phosphoglycerate kinase
MDWTVTMICGASGVGKSSVARPLAWRHRVPLVEVDDLVTALLALTTAQTHPVLHRWQTDPTVATWTPPRVVDHTLAVIATLAPGLRAVVADHIEYRAPVVMEGDYLTPDLVTGFDDARAVVISEPDEDRIVDNLRRREPHHGEQRDRARVSALFDVHLTTLAHRVGVPVVPARPFGTLLARVDAALRQPAR